MRIYSYNDIKNEYQNLKRFEMICSKHCTSEEVKEYVNEYKKDIISECRKFYKRQREHSIDYLSVPVLNNKNIGRTVSDDNGETGTDFIIIPDNGETDEDIKELVYDSVFCGYGDLLIDCTGKRCTRGWSYRRVPCGIVITHRWCFDW